MSSPLLRLPGELRNMIYRCALSDWTICLLGDQAAPSRRLKVYCHRTPWNHGDRCTAIRAILNLSSTCRQLRAETVRLPFTLNNEIEMAELRKGIFEKTTVYCRDRRKSMPYFWFERRRWYQALGLYMGDDSMLWIDDSE
jgi:hypothetical protein